MKRMKSILQTVAIILMYPLSVFLSNRELQFILTETKVGTYWPFRSDIMWFFWTVVQFILLIILLNKTIFRKTIKDTLEEKANLDVEIARVDALFEKRKAEIDEKMQEAKVESIIIKPIPVNSDPGFAASKFGGKPYWPQSKSFPMATNGKELKLLAQFNLADLPKNGLLPSKGMLQFFISDADYNLGMNGDSKIVYHEKIEQKSPDGGVIVQPTYSEEFPVKGIFSLDFSMTTEYPDKYSDTFDEILGKELSDAYIMNEDVAVNMMTYLEKKYNLASSSVDCKIGGYQNTVQSDYRTKELVLLFQMVSGFGAGMPRSHEIMWGDAGSCYFYIKKKDLENQNFKDFSYIWDCY